MSEKLRRYRCENRACPLGSRSDPGFFTGGITAEQALMLTGDPDAPHGDGYCPACGEKAVADGHHRSAEGTDPYDELHQEVAARVADPDDPLTAEGAQSVLHELVAEREA